MTNIEEKVENLLLTTIENLGYELYDVIYEKEAQDYYLRIFIDKPEGISLNDCEKVNDAISDLLDEANYIKDQYFLEVSSTGVERALRREKHFEANRGKEVVINLFKPIMVQAQDAESKNKEEQTQNTSKKKTKKEKVAMQKQIEGILKDFNQEELNVQIEKQTLTIKRKDIANIKLKYNW